MIHGLACGPIADVGFDLSAVDAELSSLGPVRTDLLELAQRYGGEPAPLDAVDRALDALGRSADVTHLDPKLAGKVSAPRLTATEPGVVDSPPSFDDPAAAGAEAMSGAYPSAREPREPPRAEPKLELSFDDLTDESDAPELSSFPLDLGRRSPQSGELALPEPVQRVLQYPGLGELTESEAPKSGSFALSAAAGTDLEQALESTPPGPTSVVHSLGLAPEMVADGELEIPPDALAESDPDTQAALSLFDEPDTATNRLKGLSDLPPPLHPDGDAPQARDPDADFDAIFSEATSPTGIPVRGFAFDNRDQNASADELHTGTSASSTALPFGALPEDAMYSRTERHPDITEPDTRDFVAHPASQADDDASDNEVTLGDAFRDEEELGSSEFEIVLDDDEQPAPKQSPPVPFPSGDTGPGEKRPSFLGRLFGRKDQQ